MLLREVNSVRHRLQQPEQQVLVHQVVRVLVQVLVRVLEHLSVAVARRVRNSSFDGL